MYNLSYIINHAATIFHWQLIFLLFSFQIDFVGHLLFQFLCQHSLLLRSDAMDRSETWMALASLGRYDGRRIDERSRQHLFRTSLSITLHSYVISFIDWLIPSFWFDWDRLKLRCWSGHSFLKWQNRKFTPSCGRICHPSRFDYRLYTISSYILFVFVFWKLQDLYWRRTSVLESALHS